MIKIYQLLQLMEVQLIKRKLPERKNREVVSPTKILKELIVQINKGTK